MDNILDAMKVVTNIDTNPTVESTEKEELIEYWNSQMKRGSEIIDSLFPESDDKLRFLQTIAGGVSMIVFQDNPMEMLLYGSKTTEAILQTMRMALGLAEKEKWFESVS